jgi:hypothetical protein
VTVGEYRFYVEFTYKGVDALGNAKSEYSVVGMEMHRVAYANSFLDSYAYYAGFGYQIENIRRAFAVVWRATSSGATPLIFATLAQVYWR